MKLNDNINLEIGTFLKCLMTAQLMGLNEPLYASGNKSIGLAYIKSILNFDDDQMNNLCELRNQIDDDHYDEFTKFCDISPPK